MSDDPRYKAGTIRTFQGTTVEVAALAHQGLYTQVFDDSNRQYFWNGTAYVLPGASASAPQNSLSPASATVAPTVDAVTGGLALKPATTAVDAALALKAATTYVDNADALKADAATTTAALALKADTSAVTAGLALKANDAATTAALALKASTSHTQIASTISDSTSVGRAVLTAVDAATARAAIGASTYTLPDASVTVLGGVKVGAGLNINSGVLAADLSAAVVTAEIAAGDVVLQTQINSRALLGHTHTADSIGTLPLSQIIGLQAVIDDLYSKIPPSSPSAPQFTAVPTISAGTSPTTLFTVTPAAGTTGTITGRRYTWRRNGTPIPGAINLTGTTYQSVNANGSTGLTVTEEAYNTAGSSFATSAVRALDASAAALWIAGTALTISTSNVKSVSAKGLAAQIFYTQNHIVAGAGENMLLWSEDMDNAAWEKYTVTVAPDTHVSPNSALQTLDTVTFELGGELRQIFAVAPSTEYTFSFECQRGTSTALEFWVYDFSNATAPFVSTSYYADTNASTPSTISHTFTTAAGCTSIALYPINNAEGTVIIGDIDFRLGAAAGYNKTEGGGSSGGDTSVGLIRRVSWNGTTWGTPTTITYTDSDETNPLQKGYYVDHDTNLDQSILAIAAASAGYTGPGKLTVYDVTADIVRQSGVGPGLDDPLGTYAESVAIEGTEFGLTLSALYRDIVDQYQTFDGPLGMMDPSAAAIPASSAPGPFGKRTALSTDKLAKVCVDGAAVRLYSRASLASNWSLVNSITPANAPIAANLSGDKTTLAISSSAGLDILDGVFPSLTLKQTVAPPGGGFTNYGRGIGISESGKQIFVSVDTATDIAAVTPAQKQSQLIPYVKP